MVDGKATTKTAADLRVDLAGRRPRLYQYQLAVRARVNPTRLSAILNERQPLTPAIADRLARAIAGDEAGARRG